MVIAKGLRRGMDVIGVGDGRDGCGWGVAALVMLLNPIP